MMPYYTSKRIVLIDYQHYWREISTKALRSFGLVVNTVDSYNYLPKEKCLAEEHPNLVVFGCSRIRQEEQTLIDDILAHNHHLLVLCTSLMANNT